ncbi:hypothetical protein D3C81_889070 [compost metagenome]
MAIRVYRKTIGSWVDPLANCPLHALSYFPRRIHVPRHLPAPCLYIWDVRRSPHSLPPSNRNPPRQCRDDVLGAPVPSHARQGIADPGCRLRDARDRLHGSAVPSRPARRDGGGPQQSHHSQRLLAGARRGRIVARAPVSRHIGGGAHRHGAVVGSGGHALAGGHVELRQLVSDCGGQRADRTRDAAL